RRPSSRGRRRSAACRRRGRERARGASPGCSRRAGVGRRTPRPGPRRPELRRAAPRKGIRLSGYARELRDDLPPVRLQGLLLAVRHEVDVELVDADRLELAQLRGDGLDAAENAEAVDDLVGHELAVLRADARVLLVVVELSRLDEVGQLLGDLGVLAVALD